jgi:hypothetical protein
MAVQTPTRLHPFEGRDVVNAGIEIPSVAGGLREALKVEPIEMGHDEETYVILRLRVRKVRFDKVPDTDVLTRTHVMDCLGSAFVSGPLAESMAQELDAQQARIERAKGIERLDFGSNGVEQRGDE